MKSDNKKSILQTNKVHLFLVVILTALCLLLTLAGCNNIVENPGTGNQNPLESGSSLVAVTGQISFSGAFPGALQSSTGSQRTAIPTVGAVTYTVTAQNKADPGERVTAQVEGTFNYTLHLSPGNWVLSCSGVNESGSQIIREKRPIELTVIKGESIPVPGSLELVLSQTPGTGGTGKVSLNGAIDFVKDSSATVTVDITLTPWGSSVVALTIPQQTIKGNGNFTVTHNTVPSGAYTMRLVISVDGIAVSTVEEAVNVFDNMTTDTWYVGGGNSDHLISQQDGSAVFNLTRCRTEFFIDGTGGDDTNPGSALKPLKTMGKAFSVLGKVKGADAKITLQSDTGDTKDVTVPAGVHAVIFGEQAATVPELISVGNGATVKVGTNVTCTGGVMVQNGGSLTLTQGGRIDGTRLSGIKNSSGGAVYIEGGTFTMESGSAVTGGNVSANGGAVYVDSGTFTMNGGTISHGNAMLGGNGVFVNIGDFVMNGGEITECGKDSQPGNGAVMIYKSSSGDGAGRFVMKNNGKIHRNSATQGAGVFVNGGTFEMSGGSISDNEAIGPTGSGGAVYVYNGSFDMSGNATINNNQSSMDAGGVYVGSTFSVSGSPTITGNTVSGTANNVYLPRTKTITIGTGGLSGGTIGVTAEAMTANGTARITDIDVPGAANKFTSDISLYSVEENIATTDGGTAVFLSDVEVAYKTTSSAQGKKLGSFEFASNTNCTEITLLKDITPTPASGVSWPIVCNWTCTLDLNGHAIDRKLSTDTDEGQVIVVTSSGDLTIKDSSAGADGTGGTGKITGGYDSGNGMTGNSGGGIYVESGSLTLESGNISKNKAAQDGGGVYLGPDGTFTMKGGSITGNTAGSNGNGNRNGGGVYVSSGCEFTMTGGSITDNTANANGGGVYVHENGTFFVSGSPTITGNTVSGNANNVYLLGVRPIMCGSQGLTGGTIGITVATSSLQAYLKTSTDKIVIVQSVASNSVVKLESDNPTLRVERESTQAVIKLRRP
ncbi:MAG: autotransporter adhesin family protein [Spirochaetia bacterium]|nr:autotransporter adhesin family protein [Spirochaetia bacterium]